MRPMGWRSAADPGHQGHRRLRAAAEPCAARVAARRAQPPSSAQAQALGCLLRLSGAGLVLGGQLPQLDRFDAQAHHAELLGRGALRSMMRPGVNSARSFTRTMTVRPLTRLRTPGRAPGHCGARPSTPRGHGAHRWRCAAVQAVGRATGLAAGQQQRRLDLRRTQGRCARALHRGSLGLDAQRGGGSLCGGAGTAALDCNAATTALRWWSQVRVAVARHSPPARPPPKPLAAQAGGATWGCRRLRINAPAAGDGQRGRALVHGGSCRPGAPMATSCSHRRETTSSQKARMLALSSPKPERRRRIQRGISAPQASEKRIMGRAGDRHDAGDDGQVQAQARLITKRL